MGKLGHFLALLNSEPLEASDVSASSNKLKQSINTYKDEYVCIERSIKKTPELNLNDLMGRGIEKQLVTKKMDFKSNKIEYFQN